jgi:hypothetical protein
MPWSSAVAIAAGYLSTKETMKNWRVINNNMIQTHRKYVWLWDNAGGVAVLAPVPSRPWKKINPDFTHWMQGAEGEAFPAPPIDSGTKIAFEDGSVLTIDREGDEFTLLPII